MTTEVKRSLKSAAGVLVCLLALGGGVIHRDRLTDQPGGLNISNYVASTSDHTDLPESKFFDDILELLKSKYVENISDEYKLADGAVRGMVASLGDPNSLYMDADQFRVYQAVRHGSYEGIGADLILARDRQAGKIQLSGEADPTGENRLPKLMIAAVVPGSPADKAGLKPGDWAEYVDEHWVPNSDAFDRFTHLADLVKAKKATAAEYLKMRHELRDAAEKNILPIKARDRLMIGTSGVVNTIWVRGEKRIPAALEKGEWTMPGFAVQTDGSIRLPFVASSAEQLRAALKGKTEATIDLRSNVDGDFDAMMSCLKVVAPNGTYGYLSTRKSAEKATALTIADGVQKPVKLTLLVDRTTRGAAEIFALALSSKGIAKLSGDETAGSRYVVKWFSLPGGAGYSLVTAEFSPNMPKGVVAQAMPSDKQGMPK